MSDDTIKREKVIATIGVMYERCDTRDITDYRDLLLESVKVLPTAEREGKRIEVSVLREILGDVQYTHRGNSEAEAVIADVWDEVKDALKGADDE